MLLLLDGLFCLLLRLQRRLLRVRPCTHTMLVMCKPRGIHKATKYGISNFLWQHWVHHIGLPGLLSNMCSYRDQLDVPRYMSG